MIEKIREQYKRLYGTEPLVVVAPGRVNLIGEHTDYNNGFVLPGAIDKQIVLAASPNNSTNISVLANEFSETFEFDPAKIGRSQGWKNYILGVAQYVQEQSGRKIGGLTMIVDGDIPVGGGLSSSAALCSGFGFLLNELFQLGLSRLDLAKIGQKTEHNFVGAKVGIMDQFASLHGKAGHLIKLDCRSMDYEYVPFDFPDYRIVLVNSMVKHEIAASEYNDRRHQCEEGVRILKKHYPGIESLRDVTLGQVNEHKEELGDVVYRRCRFVTGEIERLLHAVEALKKNDLNSFGEYMYETHEGLSRDYEVSVKELDFLVEQAKKFESVKGSRMMGGGFGGCTINIVEASGVEEFREKIQAAYQQQFNQVPEVYVTTIQDGVHAVKN